MPQLLQESGATEPLGRVLRQAHTLKAILTSVEEIRPMDSLDEAPQQASDSSGAVSAARPAQTDNSEASATMSYVFALGRVAPRFPGLAIEKEFAQVAGETRPKASPTDKSSSDCSPTA